MNQEPCYDRVDLRVVFGRISDARMMFGVSRSWIYRMAAAHPGLLRKTGRSTLVDFNQVRQLLAELPAADIRPTA